MFYPKLAMFLWIYGTLNKYDDDDKNANKVVGALRTIFMNTV
jgi:hypothetical protein